MTRALRKLIFLALLGGLLGGCASTRMVESEVSAFSRWTPAPPAPGSSYRFERLLSQQPEAQQAELEALAEVALTRVGLRHQPQTATLSVQINASTQPMLRPRWGSAYDAYPYGGSSLFIGSGIGMGGGGAVGFSFGFPFGGMEPPFYKRELSIVIRELRGNTLVYESRAVSDEPWHDSGPVLAAMFDAALRGFPLPPAGPQRIKTEITK